MAYYLVVAHQTAASPELIAKLQEMLAADPEAKFVLLVPATPANHLLVWVEGEAQQIAQRRATESAAVLTAAGLPVVDALVGASDPLQAITAEHERKGRAYEQIVISTLPMGLSRWLRRNLPDQVRRKLGVPVVQLVNRGYLEPAGLAGPT